MLRSSLLSALVAVAKLDHRPSKVYIFGATAFAVALIFVTLQLIHSGIENDQRSAVIPSDDIQRNEEPVNTEAITEQNFTTSSHDAPNDKVALGGEGINVWASATGLEVWDRLKFSDFSDPEIIGLLMTVRSACRVAQQQSAIPATDLENLAVANNVRATRLFLAQYCGDASALIGRINAALGPGEAALKQAALASLERGEVMAPISQPKRFSDLEKMVAASQTSSVAADAVVNELLVSKSPDEARNLASLLASASENQGALALWKKYLPTNVSRIERQQIFALSGEISSCQRLQTCGINSLYSLYECSIGGGGRCQPNEDLLSYRRRTTSPMLYQAAEQIAAAMQARRYR